MRALNSVYTHSCPSKTCATWITVPVSPSVFFSETPQPLLSESCGPLFPRSQGPDCAPATPPWLQAEHTKALALPGSPPPAFVTAPSLFAQASLRSLSEVPFGSSASGHILPFFPWALSHWPTGPSVSDRRPGAAQGGQGPVSYACLPPPQDWGLVVGQITHHRKRGLRAQQLRGPCGDPGSGKVGGQTEARLSQGAATASALQAAMWWGP